MSEERKEKLFNKMYYDYLEREEAEEVIDYLLKLEEKNKQLQEENRQLKIENTNYEYKLMNGNSNLQELKENIEKEKIYKYKLIEDKNGTIIINGKRYKMVKSND